MFHGTSGAFSDGASSSQLAWPQGRQAALHKQGPDPLGSLFPAGLQPFLHVSQAWGCICWGGSREVQGVGPGKAGEG